MTEHEANPTGTGQRSYAAWRTDLAAQPEYQAIYEEEAAKSALWLQLAEAREAAGLTQAQVARLEKRGYDAYTLSSLRRYVKALGDEFALEVRVQQHGTRPKAPATP